MPLPLTEQETWALNNDVLPAFTRMDMGDRLNVLGNPSGGADFYVNSNLSATAGDGSSWAKAYKTLAEAMAASHALIATGLVYWAARNRIFYKGDNNSETLITLAQKTDIWGVGSGGGHRTKATIVGTHVIGAGAYVGCRFYNMAFMPAAATNNIFTVPATSRGLEFHNCEFDGSAPIAGSAIVATAIWFLKVMNCGFYGQFTDAVIEILAGNAQGSEFKGNYVEGANTGIELNASTTASPRKILIEANTIRTGTECIADNAGIALVVNNRCATVQSDGTGGAGVIISGEFLSLGNMIAGDDLANAHYPALGTLA